MANLQASSRARLHPRALLVVGLRLEHSHALLIRSRRQSEGHRLSSLLYSVPGRHQRTAAPNYTTYRRSLHSPRSASPPRRGSDCHRSITQVSIFFAPFARISYPGALSLWLTLTTIFYSTCCYCVWRACPNLRKYKYTVVILALAFPAFWHLIAWGQTSALALACFAPPSLHFEVDLTSSQESPSDL